MEHDIRDLFDKSEEPKKVLPKNHRKEFSRKLNQVVPKKIKRKPFFFIKIAASILLIISSSYFYLDYSSDVQKTAKTEIQIQVEIFEKEYLTNINKEWETFVSVSRDTVLINKYKVKLKESKIDYKKITKQLKQQPNNINVLQSLINNLQRRLQLVKDIKEHVKELNQKNTSNETIYL